VILIRIATATSSAALLYVAADAVFYFAMR